MRHSSLLNTVLCSIIGLSNLDAFAGLPDYKSREIESANSKFVLVLLRPNAERKQLSEFVVYVDAVYNEFTDMEKSELIEEYMKELAIEEKYPVSGLYVNNGSNKPIWTSSYISTCQNVYVANDGAHMVIMYSPWDSTCSGTRQLSFYKSGRKVQSYVTEFEFVPFIFMRYFMCYFGLERPVDKVAFIDNESHKFIIHTNQNDKLSFDLSTGSLTKCSSPWPYYFGIPLVMIPASVWILKRRIANLRSLRQQVQDRNYQFSLVTLLRLTAFVSIALTVLKLYHWVGGACVLIASIGSIMASMRNRYAGACIMGAIMSLYGAYTGALFYTSIEDLLYNTFNISPLWWRGGWWQCIPLGVILLFAICGSVLARWVLSDKSVGSTVSRM